MVTRPGVCLNDKSPVDDAHDKSNAFPYYRPIIL